MIHLVTSQYRVLGALAPRCRRTIIHYNFFGYNWCWLFVMLVVALCRAMHLPLQPPLSRLSNPIHCLQTHYSILWMCTTHVLVIPHSTPHDPNSPSILKGCEDSVAYRNITRVLSHINCIIRQRADFQHTAYRTITSLTWTSHVQRSIQHGWSDDTDVHVVECLVYR